MAHKARGKSSTLPPEAISAVRKTAIRGAWIAPAITAAMPKNTKMPIGRPDMQTVLNVAANRNPATAPANSVGAKSPATPPPLLVEDVAKALTANMPAAIRIGVMVWIGRAHV